MSVCTAFKSASNNTCIYFQRCNVRKLLNKLNFVSILKKNTNNSLTYINIWYFGCKDKIVNKGVVKSKRFSSKVLGVSTHNTGVFLEVRPKVMIQTLLYKL